MQLHCMSFETFPAGSKYPNYKSLGYLKPQCLNTWTPRAGNFIQKPKAGVECFRVKVSGSGFRVSSSGFRVFRMFQVYGLRFTSQSPESKHSVASKQHPKRLVLKCSAGDGRFRV